MKFIKKLLKYNKDKNEKNPSKKREKISNPAFSTIKENIFTINQVFSNTEDLVIKNLEVKDVQGVIIYLETMVDKEKIQKYVLNPCLKSPLEPISDMLGANFQSATVFNQVEAALLEGSCVLSLDGYAELFIVDVSLSKERSITEPENEKVVQGSHDGFIETLLTNLHLLRKTVQSPNLSVKYLPTSTQVKSKIALVYLNNLVNEEIIHECEYRIKSISMDNVVNIGFLEELIEDSTLSPFPQLLNTERVDRVAGHLNEGRVAVLMEGSPTALILPVTFFAFYQSPDDYSSRWIIGTFIRSIRHASFLISIILPAFYIAVIASHFEVLPDELVNPVGSSINKIPFPPLIEALIMELTIELIREAGIRLPSRIGQTIGIVGGLVIGDAVVQAGLISTTMIVVVALTAISSFCVPSHGMSDAVRLLRFPFMFLAASFGFVGIVFGFIVLLAHLCKLESFGTPYFAPFAPLRIKDIKDTFLRLPIWKLKTRPLDSHPKHIEQQDPLRGWNYNDTKRK
ncbi:spore germination protein [Priestia megaterium]|uniref:spore germination protein n=1 Tax=Priestia megaterium TaxID=1404 RepID=UPI002E24AB92|nr:spore germination protein [Priestia megaterium]